MLKIIENLCRKLADDIAADNTNLTFEDQCKILKILTNIDEKEVEMSKSDAAEYLKMSRATFDNKVRDGFIPKGREVPGFKEKRWYKSDLDLYIMNNQ